MALSEKQMEKLLAVKEKSKIMSKIAKVEKELIIATKIKDKYEEKLSDLIDDLNSDSQDREEM